MCRACPKRVSSLGGMVCARVSFGADFAIEPYGTMTREAFGPNLRRARMRLGISLDTIAAETKVSVDLWDAMEHNDLRRWPTGIFARAYIREYARIVGADPEETVDELCRWFPQGDRRTDSIARAQADILGHRLDWRDDLPPSVSANRRFARVEPPSGAAGLAAGVADRWTALVDGLAHVFVWLRRARGRA